jgi:uncharacterized YccA/Bax inhibitor family protein
MADDDALVRWERSRREQLGIAITLIFGLSSGALAFCASLLTQKDVTFGGAGTSLYLLSVGVFVVALVASVAVTITRLEDFRTTAHIVRERKSGADASKLARWRCRARCLSKATWVLFYVQLVSFFVGAVLLLFTLWTIYHKRLFP